MPPAFVTFENVSKHYLRGRERVSVLEGFNLQLQQGEFAAIMGPSGSGKTTLLNLLGGLDRPSSGQITVADQRIDRLSSSQLAAWRAHNVGFVFQFYNLMPTLSAARNIELPLLLASLSGRERHRRVEVALELVGLNDRGKHRPGELSGGQQQRVAIARALIADPQRLAQARTHDATAVADCGRIPAIRLAAGVEERHGCRAQRHRRGSVHGAPGVR